MSAIALTKLRFTPTEKNKLSELAMEVEIHEKKRFAINKNVVHISELLNFAIHSTNPLVMRAVRQFALNMTDDTAQLLRVLSVDVDRLKTRSFVLTDPDERRHVRAQQIEAKQKTSFKRFFGLKTKDFV